MFEAQIQRMPRMLRNNCLDYATTPSQPSSSAGHLISAIPKLSLPMLSLIVPALVQDAELTASVVLVPRVTLNPKI